MPITLQAFYMGRDVTYKSELTAAIQANAIETVRRANLLLECFYAAGGASPRGVNSGWRPPEVNSATAGAAKVSKHMLGEAIDISDSNGSLDAYCMTSDGQAALAEIGLWLEDPGSTSTWCHVQTTPPGSGHRVFFP